MIHDPPVEEVNGRTPETSEAAPDADGGDSVTIYIDRNSFVVPRNAVTGAVLRQLPSPPIRGDFDLFRVAVGETEDVLVHEGEVVELEEGARFFTAPQMIHAG
jgi:hypothetical protein